MLILTWIVTGLLAALNLLAGAGKAFTRWPQLQKKMPWTQTTGKGQAYLAAWSEVVGAIGLVIPLILAQAVPGWEWAKWVAFAAAIGLTLVQVLAIRLHLSRKETNVTINIVLIVLGLASVILIALA